MSFSVAAVAAFAAQGDRIWIHDYHLMLLPQMLRLVRPDLQIAYFHHIPFPSSEVFRKIPQRNEILRGLLGCGSGGFPTFDYVRHFMTSCSRLLGAETNFNHVRTGSSAD